MMMNFTKTFSKSLLCLIVLTGITMVGCDDDSAGGDTNASPTIANAVGNLNLDEGVGSQLVDFSNVFSDADGDNLTVTALSSNTAVATVSISGNILTISEQSNGVSTITLTASDGTDDVSDQFTVTIAAFVCPNDNSTNTTNTGCPNGALVNTYSETISGDTRTIVTNGVPNHGYNIQIPNVNSLNDDDKTYRVDATPSKAVSITSLVNSSNGLPQYAFGVSLNGVKIDPAPAEPFIFEDTETGEFNWDWVFEPNSNYTATGLDCALGHIQPDGEYHYHGDMAVYADLLLAGLGSGTTTPTEVVQMGWAADGYPILYRFGKDGSGNIKKMASSYRIKSGTRPGDGASEPCGEYNGKYTNDYEYVSGLGDLDECNGITQSITIGGQTYNYYYVITEAFPVISRCAIGTVDVTFRIGG